MVGLVRRSEHLRLVDVVDLERLEDLRLDEVPDPRLGHHRDGDRLLDLLDHLRVRHPGHTAVLADVGRHALERHHRGRAGLLGDPGVLGRDHVHDHAALEHLGEAGLDSEGPRLHVGIPAGDTHEPGGLATLVTRSRARPARRVAGTLAAGVHEGAAELQELARD